MDLVDVVDKDDKVIGRISKEQAHLKGALHRTVIGQVFNSKGQWLLVKQSPTRQDPLKFVSPVGGHVLAGESEDRAIIRESQEELGISNFKYKLVGKAIFNRFILNRQENHYFIFYEILWDGEIILNYESDSFSWFTNDELLDNMKKYPENFGGSFVFDLSTFYPDLFGKIALWQKKS